MERNKIDGPLYLPLKLEDNKLSLNVYKNIVTLPIINDWYNQPAGVEMGEALTYNTLGMYISTYIVHN